MLSQDAKVLLQALLNADCYDGSPRVLKRRTEWPHAQPVVVAGEYKDALDELASMKLVDGDNFVTQDGLLTAKLLGLSFDQMEQAKQWAAFHATQAKTCVEARDEKRPADYEQLSPSVQWEIDKQLGILDWDGT